MTAPVARILINCLSAGSGGALSYVRNLLPRLLSAAEAKEKPIEFLFLYHSRQRELFSELPGEACIEVDSAWTSNPYKRLFWEKRHLGALAAKHGVDTIFVPAQFSAIVRGFKRIFLIGNMEPFFFQAYRYEPAKLLRNMLLAPLSRRVLSSADRVIAISEFSRNHCRDAIGIPEDRLSLIYHGRDTNFSPQGGPRDEETLAKFGLSAGDYVFSCGSMLPYRRFEDVILAYRLLAAERPGLVPLVLAGGQEDGRYDRLIKTMIGETAPAGIVRHIGTLGYEDIQVLYRNSLAFVMSSEIEACPIVAIEAMTSGCSIVACSKAPEPEMFRDAALFYPARDTRLLADRLVELFDSPALRRDLSRKALARAAFFSWDKCAEQTYEVLAETVMQSSRRT